MVETETAGVYILDMVAKPPKRPDNTPKALQRWNNEGGAPPSGDRSARKQPKRPRDTNQLAKHVVGIATGQVEDRDPTPEEQGKDPAAVVLGQKGGKARAAKMSPERRAKIAKDAAKKRWAKKPEPVG